MTVLLIALIALLVVLEPRRIMRNLVTVIATLAILAALPSCGPLKSGTRAAAESAIDCAKQDIAQRVSSDGLPLLAEVAGIVSAGGEGWEGALANLGTKLGEDALACAVEAARVGFTQSGVAHFSGIDPAVRAADYVRARGWKFANN